MLKLKIIGLWVAFLLPLVGHAQVQSIPIGIRDGANVVVNRWEEELEIVSISRAVRKVSATITIMNDGGEDWAQLTIPYDKFSQISNISARILGANGNLIRRVRKKEIKDYSDFSSFSVLEDNRQKVIDMRQGKFPYTIEYSYEVVWENMMFLPGFAPVLGGKQAVQYASFRVITPKDYALRYKCYNIAEPALTSMSTLTEYRWEIKNQPAIELEPMMADFEQLVPFVRLAPTQFTLDGYRGDMSSWESYGAFISKLLEGRNDLSRKRKEYFRDMVAGTEGISEKVAVLYEYLQENTRYVSIQLGIGGWQPFKTSFVDEQGYGDCKALSYYMKSILDAVNVPSYYTVVKAGSRYQHEVLDRDFPNSSFNHVILAVPNGMDTLWLECTSQTAPIDYQGVFTGNREALMITPAGGRIVKTRQYAAQENRKVTAATIIFDEKGNASIAFRSEFSGLQYATSGVSAVLHDDEDARRKWLHRSYSLPNINIGDLELFEFKDGQPRVVAEVAVEARRAANVSGKRMFITPNMLNRLDHGYTRIGNRQTEMEIGTGFEDVDSVQIQVPDGFYPEVLPDPVQIESEFGRYEAHYVAGEDGLLYTRRMVRKGGVYAPESFNDYVDFLNAVEKADRTKLVLVNKT